MLHFEPIPLLEAHCYFSGRAAGFSPSNYYADVMSLGGKYVDELAKYADILKELYSRLETSVTVDEETIRQLYSSMNTFREISYSTPDDHVANLLIGNLEKLVKYDGHVDDICDDKSCVLNEITEFVTGEPSCGSVDLSYVVDIINNSSLQQESKLRLIDVSVHTQRNMKTLAEALAPVAGEFKRCRKLIAPLLNVFRDYYAHENEDCDAIAMRLFKHECNVEHTYNVYPLVVSAHNCTFEEISHDDRHYFGGIGVLYEYLWEKFGSAINMEVSSMMSMLGSKTRFKIISMLAKGPLFGRELAANLNFTPATVSHHIGLLASVGLVNIENAGARAYYSLNKERMEYFIEKQRVLFLDD